MRPILFLLSMSMLAAAPPESRLDKAFQIVREAVDRGQAPGAIALVSAGGRVLREEAYGFSDLEGKVPFQKNTICWIASVTKPVTAAAVMTLVDAGKIGLDDPVEKYLPEFRDQIGPGGKHHPVTIRHLLSHSSGLPMDPPTRKSTWPIGDALSDYWLAAPLPGIIESVARTPLRFEPGSKAEYSNPAFFVLGRIIEVVSGKPYAVYVKDKVLDPLGMRESCYAPPPSKAKRVAVLYGKRDGQLRTIYRFQPGQKIVNTAPDGGLFSYPGEFVKFVRIFQQGGGKVLSRRAVDEMLREQSPGFGCSWAVKEGVYRHGGSSGTMVWFEPKGVIAILFLQYRDRPDTIDDLKTRFWEAVREARQ